ncbi:hypothetical protein [Opitutus terrae]|uniref:Uncharacterized protein n=1 Tax=Opitutus terrae (strain DSM 11246 / JCM 15787 / PB90-1) TaxID=452637 RepID=B1ZUA1_OPITP|nr:hypothetical protein [Opitutus terrae]ACB76663.1 hypothetical protein Oter_3386 [Opitutus terrae PB90-1]
MSETQLRLPLDAPHVVPLLVHYQTTADHLLAMLEEEIKIAASVGSCWTSDLDKLLELASEALEGDYWRIGTYRDCAQRLLRRVGKADLIERERAVVRLIARHLDELADACDTLRARQEFEYHRSMAA